ncbi:MAG: nuclear transport factor 2 family protein [Acidobacteriota bacterium]|nr:nuclear transport factor 2 family protein [Acidobacteriota bacterium]
MKTVLVIFALMFGVYLAVGQTMSKKTNGNGRVEQELKNLERQWEEALTRRDVAALDRLMAEDYVLTTVRGEVVNKAKVLEEVKSANVTAKVQNTDTAVRVYGDTAVVTGLVLISGRFNDQEVSTQSRYLKVYVRGRGRWQVVAAQATLVAQQ